MDDDDLIRRLSIAMDWPEAWSAGASCSRHTFKLMPDSGVPVGNGYLKHSATCDVCGASASAYIKRPSKGD